MRQEQAAEEQDVMQPHRCRWCALHRRPGRAPGYCASPGRDDLPPAYGIHHPLRKLPADQGASCASYTPHD